MPDQAEGIEAEGGGIDGLTECVFPGLVAGDFLGSDVGVHSGEFAEAREFGIGLAGHPGSGGDHQLAEAGFGFVACGGEHRGEYLGANRGLAERRG